MRVTYKELLGKVVLAGLTYTTEDGDFAGQTEFWGTVTQANKKRNCNPKARRRNIHLPTGFVRLFRSTAR